MTYLILIFKKILPIVTIRKCMVHSEENVYVDIRLIDIIGFTQQSLTTFPATGIDVGLFKMTQECNDPVRLN